MLIIKFSTVGTVYLSKSLQNPLPYVNEVFDLSIIGKLFCEFVDAKMHEIKKNCTCMEVNIIGQATSC